jgi:hypothetical protein
MNTELEVERLVRKIVDGDTWSTEFAYRLSANPTFRQALIEKMTSRIVAEIDASIEQADPQ